MSDSVRDGYWCYECRRVVSVVIDEPKCPNCDSAFVEEIERRGDSTHTDSVPLDGSPRPFSLWAPMMWRRLADSSRQPRNQREEEEDEDDTDFDREFEDLLTRRRRSSAILRVLHSLYFDDRYELDDFTAQRARDGERDDDGDDDDDDDDDDDGGSVVVVESSIQATILQGLLNNYQNRGDNDPNGGNSDISFGDYFFGPSLDLLLHHLAENDTNRYGTPPANQEAVDALPTVNVSETLRCSVCLEDCDIGTEVKEMPCKHKFHTQCILPWLELHSSCPLCRFLLPTDESKVSNRSRNLDRMENDSRFSARNGTGNEDVSSLVGLVDETESLLPVLSPFNLFHLSENENNGGSDSNPDSFTSNSQHVEDSNRFNDRNETEDRSGDEESWLPLPSPFNLFSLSENENPGDSSSSDLNSPASDPHDNSRGEDFLD